MPGTRSPAQITTFDFVLLIISEAMQQALLGKDFSITNAFVVIVTMVGLDIGLSLLKQRWTFLTSCWRGLPWSSSRTGTCFGSA
ncbi:MAG: hypothetical protein AB1790_09910 [Pseudomonadota bacterium]